MFKNEVATLKFTLSPESSLGQIFHSQKTRQCETTRLQKELGGYGVFPAAQVVN